MSTAITTGHGQLRLGRHNHPSFAARRAGQGRGRALFWLGRWSEPLMRTSTALRFHRRRRLYSPQAGGCLPSASMLVHYPGNTGSRFRWIETPSAIVPLFPRCSPRVT